MTELEELEVAKAVGLILRQAKMVDNLARRNCIDNDGLSLDMKSIKELCNTVLDITSKNKKKIRRVNGIDASQKDEIPTITIDIK